MTDVDASIRALEPRLVTGYEEAAAEHVLDERTSRPKVVPHFTPAERAARGKAARGELPRSSHAAWEPGPSRRDPVDPLEEHGFRRAADRPESIEPARPDERNGRLPNGRRSDHR
jgi:hypothetical protein